MEFCIFIQQLQLIITIIIEIGLFLIKIIIVIIVIIKIITVDFYLTAGPAIYYYQYFDIVILFEYIHLIPWKNLKKFESKRISHTGNIKSILHYFTKSLLT